MKACACGIKNSFCLRTDSVTDSMNNFYFILSDEDETSF